MVKPSDLGTPKMESRYTMQELVEPHVARRGGNGDAEVEKGAHERYAAKGTETRRARVTS